MTTFDWCLSSDHENCKREFQRHTFDPKTKKVVWLDEVIRCECRKRGCKCHVPARLRTKSKKKVKKR